MIFKLWKMKQKGLLWKRLIRALKVMMLKKTLTGCAPVRAIKGCIMFILV